MISGRHHRRGGLKPAALIGLCALGGLCGCVAGPTQPAPLPKPGLLTFLDAERVTREDVYAHLGAPHATFEREHVIAYRLGRIRGGYFVMAAEKHNKDVNWEGVSDDLVLAFDDEGTLQQHSLVPIGAPDKR